MSIEDLKKYNPIDLFNIITIGKFEDIYKEELLSSLSSDVNLVTWRYSIYPSYGSEFKLKVNISNTYYERSVLNVYFSLSDKDERSRHLDVLGFEKYSSVNGISMYRTRISIVDLDIYIREFKFKELENDR